MTAPPNSNGCGIFEGSILITAQPITEQDKKLLSAEQIEALAKHGGYIVGVQVRGQLDSHGLGRALGACLQSYINEVAAALDKPFEQVAPECIRQVLGPMIHYVGGGTTVWKGKIQ